MSVENEGFIQNGGPLKRDLKFLTPARETFTCQFCSMQFEEFDYLMEGVKEIWCGQCDQSGELPPPEPGEVQITVKLVGVKLPDK
jgi:hypothetical protein